MDEPRHNVPNTTMADPDWRRYLPRFYLALVVVGALLVALTMSTSLTGTIGDGSLLGTVTDVDGMELDRIVVVLHRDEATWETLTDEHGQFKFLSIDPGNYTIEAYGEGYPRQRYESVHVRRGPATTLSMKLRLAVRQSEEQQPDPSQPVPHTEDEANRP